MTYTISISYASDVNVSYSCRRLVTALPKRAGYVWVFFSVADPLNLMTPFAFLYLIVLSLAVLNLLLSKVLAHE